MLNWWNCQDGLTPHPENCQNALKPLNLEFWAKILEDDVPNAPDLVREMEADPEAYRSQVSQWAAHFREYLDCDWKDEVSTSAAEWSTAFVNAICGERREDEPPTGSPSFLEATKAAISRVYLTNTEAVAVCFATGISIWMMYKTYDNLRAIWKGMKVKRSPPPVALLHTKDKQEPEQ